MAQVHNLEARRYVDKLVNEKSPEELAWAVYNLSCERNKLMANVESMLETYDHYITSNSNYREAVDRQFNLLYKLIPASLALAFIAGVLFIQHFEGVLQ